jgi:hypothetical protein
MACTGAVIVIATDAHGQGTPASAQSVIKGEGVRVALRESAGAAAEPGVFVSADEGGVTTTNGDGKARVISWDKVRSLGDAPSVQTPTWAEALWRARARIEREDYSGAEPLLESIAAGMESTGGLASGASGAVLYEGVLRCRLHRGVHTAAVGPYFAWRRATGLAISADARAAWIGGSIRGAQVIDGRTGLCTELPPIWLNEPALTRAAIAKEDWDRLAPAGSVADPLIAWYRASMLYESAASEEEANEARALAVKTVSTSVTDAERLVQSIVLSRLGDDKARADARAALENRLSGEEVEGWLEAWCRAAIGRSLVHETDAELRRRGVLQLLHVPARLGRTAPGLAAICLAEAANALNEMGDAAGAWALKSELVTRYPRRSPASWGPIREIKATSAVADGAVQGDGQEARR